MVVEDNQACACLLAAHVLSISAHDKSGALHTTSLATKAHCTRHVWHTRAAPSLGNKGCRTRGAGAGHVEDKSTRNP